MCSSCDQPPALSKFTPYRDDGKDGIKFYTDRNYFYDLWVQQQTQAIKDRKKRVRVCMWCGRVCMLYVVWACDNCSLYLYNCRRKRNVVVVTTSRPKRSVEYRRRSLLLLMRSSLLGKPYVCLRSLQRLPGQQNHPHQYSRAQLKVCVCVCVCGRY